LGPFSAVYRTILACRSFFYSHINKPGRLPARVISIGNLTLGGTGKTPAVIAVAKHARSLGLDPVVLTRGYKGRIKGPAFVSKGHETLLEPEDAGDEACLMAEQLSGVPVVIGRKRFLAGKFALENLDPKIDEAEYHTLFILDDGFQHLALHRDTDVLLIDATSPFGNGRLFPEGRLREPLNAMKRAGIIVITKSDMAGRVAIESTIQKIKKHNPDASIYAANHQPTALINLSAQTEALDTLKDKKLYLFSGIANPSYFQAILTSKGAEVVSFKKFRDHYSYKQSDIDKILKSAGDMDIITTEKDMVKLRGLENTENIKALKIEFSVEDAFYDELFKGIYAKDDQG
jgi:tetraacyldisaccharide 4'-kinase